MKERVVSLCRLGASELTRERLFVVQSATGGLGLLNVDAEFAWAMPFPMPSSAWTWLAAI